MSVHTTEDLTGSPRVTNPKRLPPENVARSIGGMFGDLLSLSELQLKLLKRDSSEAVSRTYFSIAILVVGLLVLFACLPVGMLAIVFVLHEFLELSMSVSLIIVVATGLFLGALLALIAYFKLKRVGNVFHRSQTELSKNVHWLKNSMDWG